MSSTFQLCFQRDSFFSTLKLVQEARKRFDKASLIYDQVDTKSQELIILELITCLSTLLYSCLLTFSRTFHIFCIADRYRFSLASTCLLSLVIAL